MNLIRSLFYLFLSLSPGTWCLGAPDFPGRLPFKVYGLPDGVPSATVHAMVQDREGFLWLATENGLYRYDGGESTRWGAREGLPSDWVTSLAVAPEGGLWVGTIEGLAQLKENRVLPVTLLGKPIHDPVVGLAVDAAGRLWGAGPVPFRQREALDCEPVPECSPQGTDSVCVGRGNSSIWFTQGNRLSERRQDGTVRTWDQKDGLGRDPINAIGEDGEGNLWVGAHRRLYLLESGGKRFQDRSSWMRGSVPMLPFPFCDAQGALWMPTTSGVLLLRKEGATLLDQRGGLPLRGVKGGLVDREGNLWLVGSSLVRLLGDTHVHVYQESEGLPSTLVWSVTRTAGGELLAGTDDGLARLGPRGFSRVPGTEGMVVMSLAAKGDDIWIAALDRGLFVLSKDDLQPRRVKPPGILNNCTFVLKDSQDRIWAVPPGHGAKCLQPESPALDLRPSDFALPYITVVTLAESPDGTLWASSVQGLFSRKEGKWTRYTTAQGLRSEALQGVFPVSDGTLWVWYNEPHGTTHFRPDKGGLTPLGHLGLGEGLSTDLVDGVTDDGKGRVWITSDQGVLQVQHGAVRRFGLGQGLPGEDCAGNSLILDPDGSLWSGLANGLVRIGPEAASRPLPTPTVQILRVSWGGTSHLMPVSLPGIVPHTQGTFEFHFAAPSYLDEKALRYQVRLLGIEEEWRDSEVRVAHFPALPGGAYTFETRAAYPGGAFGPPARLSFQVRSPFWRTGWAFAGACLFCGFLAYQLARLRLHSLARTKQKLEAIVTQRTQELRDSNGALNGLNDQNLQLIEELSATLREIQTLQGLIPICCYCKKIRNDTGYWDQIEHYIQSRSKATFSHGICPDCRKKAREDMLGGPPPEGERPQEDAGGIPVKTPG